jgi:3,4-dihydroxy 2-butanone 4-phosphate synthase/GTP cyclohydrolase II
MNLKDKIELIIKDVREGKPVIITDSFDRECEGDLFVAAEKASYNTLSFMALQGRGIMCLPCLGDRLERLEIPMMHSNKLDKFTTPFANSIDASAGISTGVSVSDRLVTISKFVDDTSIPQDFCQPGHLFPLRARPGLLQDRQGHTESSIELCILSDLKPVGIIIEIMNIDGTMARIPQLETFANAFGLNMIAIDEIIEYKYVQH